ncbi:UNVERIFIED_CONTAM: hypothetical protein GTU68_066696, partial [Idotea baltica]|nr:hypothetical protein [Idotea baltica]
GEKPYKCPYCSRCFSDKSACNSHTRVHTGYERSVCTVCGASFSKKQRLNYHMRMHTGEGLLYCPLCVRPSTNSYSLRKHIECHQQPLTKALASLGFKPLLASDPNFVMRALQALTQATLQNISRHQNIPNSFIDDPDLLVLGGGEAPKEDSDLVEECSKTLSTIAKIEEGEGEGEGGEEEEEEEFSLTKFLQDLLEKESQKARSDGRCRRDRRLRTRTAITRDVTSPSSGGVVEFGEEEEEEELPSTIGDELVKQCLEIIMKDEPHSDQEDFDGSGMECEREDNHHHHLIKTEPPEHFDSEDLPEEEIALQLSKAQKGIPKIKISRVAKTDSTEDIFVAEIVKKM